MSGDESLKIIDAFSGCGGMTLGFVQFSKGHFTPVWANDVGEWASRSYNANFGEHCVLGDITDVLRDAATRIPAADIVIGGPPCQGFSLLNKTRANDPRKSLWKQFLEIVRRSRAAAFVMENVPQLLGSEEYDAIVKETDEMCFRVFSCKLCAADYGVPQTRYRAFLIGCSFADPSKYFPPQKTHFNPRNGYSSTLFNFDYSNEALPWADVKSAIGDLPRPEGTDIRTCDPPLDLHFCRTPTAMSIARYMSIPEQGMNRFDLQRAAPDLTPRCWIMKPSGGTDLFGRLWWDRPAFTVRTEFFKPEKGRYLHPEQHRPITHREAARFQSFPDDFVFKGNKIEIAKQIGNAVPPLLAARVADSVYQMFLSGV